jgi:hypothetical protein
MHDLPDADDLLAAARESVLGNVLPAVPDAWRYEVLMIANALAITRRMLAAGDLPLRAELEALAAIYEAPQATDLTGEALALALAELNRRLARDIRDGVFDRLHDRHDAVRALIRRSTIRKLGETKPKLLQAEGIET